MLIIEFLQGLLGDRGIEWFLMVTHLFGEASSIVVLSLYFWLINPSQGRQLGLTLVLSLMSSLLLKEIFALPRPYIINPEVITPAAIQTQWNHSFPSGHAQGITTIWGTIACFQQKVWVWWGAIAVITLVCLSRIVLGVHYSLDIVAGILLAIIWITLGFWSNQDAKQSYYHLPQKIVVWLGCGMAAIAFPQFATLLGVFSGFFPVSSTSHAVPRNLISKITLCIFGLGAIAMIYLVLDKLAGKLPTIALVDYGRYWLLTLSITEVIPTLWRGSQPVR